MPREFHWSAAIIGQKLPPHSDSRRSTRNTIECLKCSGGGKSSAGEVFDQEVQGLAALL
jgi:hypothetical protein